MKKLVAFIISLSLILTPCFAFADTASGDTWILEAGGIKPVEVAAIEAAAIGDGSKASGDTSVFLNGFSSSGTYWLYKPSSVSSLSTDYYPSGNTTLAGLASGISYSIATNTQFLSSNIASIIGYIDSIETYTDGIEGFLSNISSAVGNNIGSNVSTIASSVNTTNSRLNSILTEIQNKTFDVGTFIPNFIPDSDYDFTSSNWTTVNRRTVTTDGASSMSSYTSPYMVMQLRELLRANNNAAALTYDKMFNMVTGSDYNDANYHVIYAPNTGNQVSLYKRSFWVDFRTVSRYLTRGISLITALDPDNTYYLTDYTLTRRPVSDISIGDYLRQFGQNLTASIGRLTYVLANDYEIAARNAAENTTQAAVQNVIAPSGSGSASASDISGIANLKSSATGNLSSGVSAGTVFSEIGSGGYAWDWFTQDIADELSAPSRRSNVRSNSKSSGSDTPMLDAYHYDLEEAIGFKLPW